MLNRLFTPKWQHQDPSIREIALNNLDASNEAEIIVKIATLDPSGKLRQKALKKISDLSILQSLLSNADNPTDWCRFAYRLNEISPQVESLTTAFVEIKDSWAFNQENNQQNIDELFNLIVSYTSCQELTNSLLLSIDDPEVAFKIVTTAKSIELRLRVLEEINDIAQLRQILKKATNKQVLQQVRTKLANAKTQQKIINETIEHAESLKLLLEKLSLQTWFDPQFEIKVNHAVENWRKLDLEKVETATESQKNILITCVADFQHYLKKCQKLIADHKEELDQAAVKRDAIDKQNALCTQLKNLVKEMSEPTMNNLESLQTIKETFDFLNNSWQQTTKEAKPKENVANTYQSLQKQLKNELLPWDNFIRLEVEIETFFSDKPTKTYESLGLWLKAWQNIKTKLAWLNGSSMPSKLDEWYKLAAEHQRQYDKLVAIQTKNTRYLSQRINLLEKHCQQRNLIAANKLSNYIEKKLSDSVNDFKDSLSKKLAAVQPKLEELRDWHAFATAPKKNTLCEQMEHLINESIEPLVRAKKVRGIQQQWRELLASDPNADDQLWDRFKKASDAAYFPCLEFYAEKDKARSENLKKQIKICESLERIVKENGWNAENEAKDQNELSVSSSTNGHQWKEIDIQISKASREWKNHQPVPENEREAIQKQFNSVFSIIKKQLDIEKQTNLGYRCDLVKKAVGFYELDDIEKSIQGVLHLQKQWKELGLTFYKADREQWSLFRNAIDRVFAKRDNLKKEFKQELKNNQHEIKKITKEISLLCQLDDSYLKQSYSKFEELKNSWSYEKTLPKKNSQSLLSSFDNACEQYQEHYDGLDAREKKSTFNLLLKGAYLLQEIEEKQLDTPSLKMEEDELKRVKDVLLQLKSDSTEASLLANRFEQLKSSTQITENLDGAKQLSDLALNMEILLSIDSPENCKEQRVAMQLEQLQKGFGANKMVIDKKKEVLKMISSWVSIGFIKNCDRQQLESRKAKILNSVGL